MSARTKRTCQCNQIKLSPPRRGLILRRNRNLSGSHRSPATSKETHTTEVEDFSNTTERPLAIKNKTKKALQWKKKSSQPLKPEMSRISAKMDGKKCAKDSKDLAYAAAAKHTYQNGIAKSPCGSCASSIILIYELFIYLLLLSFVTNRNRKN